MAHQINRLTDRTVRSVPTPTDVRARVLSTGIGPDAFDCDLGSVLDAAAYFNLSAAEARAIVKATATVTAQWRAAAEARGARPTEIRRMQTAFDHDDLTQALAL